MASRLTKRERSRGKGKKAAAKRISRPMIIVIIGVITVTFAIIGGGDFAACLTGCDYPDLAVALTRTDGQDTVARGDTVSFTLTLSNVGPPGTYVKNPAVRWGLVGFGNLRVKEGRQPDDKRNREYELILRDTTINAGASTTIDFTVTVTPDCSKEALIGVSARGPREGDGKLTNNKTFTTVPC